MTILRRSAFRAWRAGRRRHLTMVLIIAMATTSWCAPSGIRADDQEEVAIALSLAKLLQSGRTVISRNQDLINDPTKGDKGLTGDVVLAETIDNYQKATGIDPRSVDPASRHGHLLQAEMAEIGRAHV